MFFLTFFVNLRSIPRKIYILLGSIPSLPIRMLALRRVVATKALLRVQFLLTFLGGGGGEEQEALVILSKKGGVYRESAKV